MASSMYPLSPQRREYYERMAVSAEPYDVEEDEMVLDGDVARGVATIARFVLRQDDKARAAAASQDTP